MPLCPHCGRTTTTFNCEPAELMIGSTILRGIVMSCQGCRKIVSVTPDSLAQTTATVAKVAEALAPQLGEIQRVVGQIKRHLNI